MMGCGRWRMRILPVLVQGPQLADCLVGVVLAPAVLAGIRRNQQLGPGDLGGRLVLPALSHRLRLAVHVANPCLLSLPKPQVPTCCIGTSPYVPCELAPQCVPVPALCMARRGGA